ARRLGALAGQQIARDAFDLNRVPPHLLVRFQVEDGDGRALASGRDLEALRRALGASTRAVVAEAAAPVERSGMRRWELDELPRVIEVDAGRHAVRAFPALVDEGSSVGVRAFPDEASQAEAMVAGTRRLLLLAAPGVRRDVERRLRAVPALAAVPAHLPGPTALVDDCLAAAADRIVTTHGGPAWDRDAAERLAAAARARLGRLALGAADLAAELVVAAHRL